MPKEKLFEILKRLLMADADIDFLMQLSEDQLKTLILCLRSRLDREKALSSGPYRHDPIGE